MLDANRLIALLFGTVIGSAAPIGLDWLVRIERNEAATPAAVIGQGQLYLSTIAVLFSVFAVILADPLPDVAQSLLIWSTLLVFGAVVALYTAVPTPAPRNASQQTNLAFVLWSSAGFFGGATLLASLSTVAAGWQISRHGKEGG